MVRRMKKSYRIFFGQIRLIIRGYKQLFGFSPKCFVWRTIYCILQQVSPFLMMYISSLIIDELLAGKSQKDVLFLSFIALLGNCCLTMASHISDRVASRHESIMTQYEELFFMKQQNRMRYEFLENADITLLRNRIINAKKFGANGFMQLYWAYSSLISAFVTIFLSLVPTITILFKTTELEFSGILGLINNSLASVIIMIAIISNVIVASVCSKKSANKIQNMHATFSKRYLSASGYRQCNGNDATIFNMKETILPYIKSTIDPYFRNKTNMIGVKYGAVQTIWNAMISIAVTVFIGAKAFVGLISIGSIVYYCGSIERLVNSCMTIGTKVGRLINNNEYMKDIFDFMELPGPEDDVTCSESPDGLADIEFRNVYFKYPGSEKYVLDNVNLTFKAGEKNAIVGTNGSGKTTIVKLICRLYTPTKGEILLGGKNIFDYSWGNYIKYISTVFQDFSVFAFSVAENISCSIQYDKNKIIEALAKVGLTDKIQDWPSGIESTVLRSYENKGIDLSGGEAQKLAIARAIYKQSPLVILDEPTAALDPVAESEIYSNMDIMTLGRTSIFISHRLSSCRFCDSIVVLDEGKIVQHGTHDELINEPDGKYYELWKAQEKYYNQNNGE